MKAQTRVRVLCGLLGFLSASAVSLELRFKEVPTIDQTLQLPPEAFVQPAWTQTEVDCLARTVYGEARNQPELGQVAVAAVVVNRSLSGRWPTDLCAVVRQKSQFAGYWAVNSTMKDPWGESYEAARIATQEYGSLSKELQTVVYFTSRHEYSKFHSERVLKGVVGDHAFYTD